MPSTAKNIDRVAHDTFGFTDLRPGQKETIEALLHRRDVLAVMPTGAGKSAIYQIVTQFLHGTTVVVSPLIALQRDQVESIQEQHAGGVGLLNSTLDAAERKATLAALEQDDLKFIFLAPEQFANAETIERLRAIGLALFVVDEAHCISEWGHDFRPDYLRLGAVIDALGRPPVLALTATAGPHVRAEIVERLGLRDPYIAVHGFDRPNIWLGVRTFADEGAKHRALVEAVAAADQPGIVYTATRHHAETIAAALAECDVRAVCYHAGMAAAERERAQDAFMNGKAEVIVATTAFGMGVDKPDVRFVYHYDISDSVDSYYQEIGRAGRDEAPARAMLFYQPRDLGIHRFFAGGGQIDLAQIAMVAQAVRARQGPVDPRELCEELDLSKTKLMTALTRLAEVDVVEILPTGDVTFAEHAGNVDAAIAEALQAEDAHRNYEKSRIEMMRGYAETLDCRRRYLLNYFGQEFGAPCAACDNCEAGVTEQTAGAAAPFPTQSRVAHQEWGEGTVQRYENEKIVVLFDAVGYKTLDLDLVVERGLLMQVA